MAIVTSYQPSPLFLPPSAPLARRFLDPRSHRRGEPPLGEADLPVYERHTIFHDVFLGDGALLAVGPPLVNLAARVRPIRCRILRDDGSSSPPLRHRLERHERCTLHRFRLPPAWRDATTLRASVELATGQRAEFDAVRQSLAPVFLQVATLQKDNRVEWIADWLGHLARLGVERVLLYDNDSADARELPARLRALEGIPDVVLVHWPFPYGPGRSHYNQFAQPSQLNHAHLCFGGAEWCGHFDVDEYPVSGSGHSLVEHLEALSPRTGLLRLDSWWAPRVSGEGTAEGRAGPTAEFPTVRDFRFRERAARGKARKYLVRTRALKSARVHNARLRLGWWRRSPATERLGFVHYLALNNGWKGERDQAVPLDPARHVEERRIIDALPPRPAVDDAPETGSSCTGARAR